MKRKAEKCTHTHTYMHREADRQTDTVKQRA